MQQQRKRVKYNRTAEEVLWHTKYCYKTRIHLHGMKGKTSVGGITASEKLKIWATLCNRFAWFALSFLFLRRSYVSRLLAILHQIWHECAFLSGDRKDDERLLKSKKNRSRRAKTKKICQIFTPPPLDIFCDIICDNTEQPGFLIHWAQWSVKKNNLLNLEGNFLANSVTSDQFFYNGLLFWNPSRASFTAYSSKFCSRKHKRQYALGLSCYICPSRFWIYYKVNQIFSFLISATP